jgi:hypothetical protein
MFTIEDWFGPFEGWTADQYWNGWACPCFDWDVALQMVDTCNQVKFKNDVFRAHYDEEHDQFCFYTESDGDWECFGAQTIEVKGRQATVYAIGAYCWIWEDASSK